MSFPEKEITCKCGHTFNTTQDRSWCDQCGKPVFYYKKDQIMNKLNYLFIILVLAVIFGFLAYIFTEMIAGPLLG